MFYFTKLPNSRDIVLIHLVNGSLFSQGSIPEVCIPFNEGEISKNKIKYSIELKLKKNNDLMPYEEIYNYRDIIIIYENCNKLLIEIADNTKKDVPILTNMGISIALSHIFCKENIFLLHAASIVRKGRGYIFPGHSGSGKTTISRLSTKNNLVLCDELSASIKTSDNNYSVIAGPKWSSFTFNPKFYYDSVWKTDSDNIYPLKAIIFPCKEDLREETWLEEVKSIDACNLLMCLFIDTPFVKILPAEDFKLAFHFFSNLTKKLPCFRIHANTETDIWQVIDKTI